MALELIFEKVFVKDGITRITKAESDITQLATQIQSSVTVEQYNALDNKVTTNQSTITQRADSIESRLTNSQGDITSLGININGVSAKINTGTHTLSESGYSFKDSKGDILLTSNGVANEQNIGRADNVEDGYPMRIPFNIGTEVSQIVQAKLKWDISPFRTYSKGAASGGGSTSGDGGSSTQTVSVYGWTQGLAAGTDGRTITTSTLGQPHSHIIYTDNLKHTHRVVIGSHQHSTPDHLHPPRFGILTTPVSSNWFSIYVDGAYRTAVDSSRGEVDLSAWITTNGWHTIELRVTSMKRIDASLFLKTYIRR